MPKLTTEEYVGVAMAIAMMMLMAFGQFNIASLFSGEEDRTLTVTPSPEPQPQALQENIMPLGIEDIVVGEGFEARPGDVVTVNYIGRLQHSGVEFDNSYRRGQPLQFTLGRHEVIEGWDSGVVGMRVGGKRKLTIPPDLGYGFADYGPIPGGSTLVFEVELLGVNR